MGGTRHLKIRLRELSNMGKDDEPMTADSCFSLRPLPVQKIRDWLLRLGDTGTSTRAVPARQTKLASDYPRVLNLISKFFAGVNSPGSPVRFANTRHGNAGMQSKLGRR